VPLEEKVFNDRHGMTLAYDIHEGTEVHDYSTSAFVVFASLSMFYGRVVVCSSWWVARRFNVNLGYAFLDERKKHGTALAVGSDLLRSK
jgi:hypothetical protein